MMIAVAATPEPDDDADDELLEWEALQREAEAQAATEAAAQAQQVRLYICLFRSYVAFSLLNHTFW
jgi:hypothetical protein